MTDHQKYKALRHLILSAKFEAKGDAVVTMASLFVWYDSLEKIFEPKKEEMKIKPIENPIDNNKDENVDR